MTSPSLPAPVPSLAAISATTGELAPREITAVWRDGAGYKAELECGHACWFAIPVAIGESRYCSTCVDRVIRAMREARDLANMGVVK